MSLFKNFFVFIALVLASFINDSSLATVDEDLNFSPPFEQELEQEGNENELEYYVRTTTYRYVTYSLLLRLERMCSFSGIDHCFVWNCKENLVLSGCDYVSCGNLDHITYNVCIINIMKKR